MIWQMGQEFTYIREEPDMKANGKMIYKMVMGKKSGPMVLNMRFHYFRYFNFLKGEYRDGKKNG